MPNEYQLSYTAKQIDERLGMVDKMVKSVNGTGPDENGNVRIVIHEVPANVSAFKNDVGYATEQYVTGYAQPKGNYLTEHQSLDGYAKSEDIPQKPEDIGAQPAGNYLTEVPKEYVKSVNGTAPDEHGNVAIDIPTDEYIDNRVGDLIDAKMPNPDLFSNTPFFVNLLEDNTTDKSGTEIAEAVAEGRQVYAKLDDMNLALTVCDGGGAMFSFINDGFALECVILGNEYTLNETELPTDDHVNDLIDAKLGGYS